MVLRHELGGPNGGVWPTGKKYVRALKSFLRHEGYDKLPA
jgi:hypothetical protein